MQKGQEDSVMTWMEREIIYEKGAQKRRQRKVGRLEPHTCVSNRAMW